MKLRGGSWSKGDFFTVLTLVAAFLAVPGMPKIFHWDRDKTVPSKSDGIVLQTAAPLPIAEPSHPVNAIPAVKGHPIKQKLAPVAQTPTVTATPSQVFNNDSVNNGIQNNCPFGTCDQSVHINEDAKPLPFASFGQSPLPPEDKTRKVTREDVMTRAHSLSEGSARFNPGTSVGITTNRIFDDPAFQIVCDAPCDITSAQIAYKSTYSFQTKGIRIIAHVLTSDGIAHKVSLAQKLEPGSSIDLTLRSRSDRTIKVISVVSISSDDVVPSN